MPSCAIITCRARSQISCASKDGISFHRFPKEPDVKEKWIDVTGRVNWFPTKFSTICSKHFSANDYIKTSGNKYLKPIAIPSKNVVVCSSLQQVPKSCNCNGNSSETFKKSETTYDTDSDTDTEQIEVQETAYPSTAVVKSCNGTELQKLNEQSNGGADNHSDTKQIKVENFEFSCLNSDATTPRKVELKEIIATKEYIIEQQRKKIRRIQAQNRRLKKKMCKMENELRELKQKRTMPSENNVVCVLKTQVRRWTN